MVNASRDENDDDYDDDYDDGDIADFEFVSSGT